MFHEDAKRKKDETQKKLFSQFEPTTSTITPAGGGDSGHISVSVNKLFIHIPFLLSYSDAHVGCNIGFQIFLTKLEQEEKFGTY